MPPDVRGLGFLHRHATPLQVLLAFALYSQLAVLGGIASAPGVYLVCVAWQATASWAFPLRVLLGCCLGWGAYF